MTQAQAPGLSDMAQALCAALILMVPLAAAGLALIHAGLGRSRSAAHAMLGSICVVAVAVLAYFVCGYSWQGVAGRAAYGFTAGGKAWNWIGAEPFFFRGLAQDDSRAALSAWLQMFSVGLAAMIPLGAGNDRWRLGASCASTALLAGWTYPLFAHWVWGGGWLAQLGVNSGWGYGLMDVGGSGAIQAVGGLTALSIACILGPRQGKYGTDRMPAAIPGHNAVVVLFACFLTWLGWIGLNGSGSLLRIGGSAAGVAMVAMVAMVAVNTTLSAAAAVLTAAVITRIRFGRPDASLCANGWTGGLVASSAACAFVDPASAAITGAIAGALVTFSVEWLDSRLSVDDPAGSISVHAAGGLWGLLALGIFARIPPDRVLNGTGAGHANQWLAQLAGVLTLIAFILPMTYTLNWLLNRFYPQRVSTEGEAHGMDLYELGAGAYPEFVIHREDFRPR
jgi:Amt family ammonium transporter